ncbi:hypothetical protein E2C01_067396 [Portunus trituberculatus]|uniref:Uncharacterized protein n=1 Tax=Portunus trituberculatus TaxID=210409 RepID=A0A5B7HWK9_PORTR|nr:hypothetical protein [Portunus trituberculatus]
MNISHRSLFIVKTRRNSFENIGLLSPAATAFLSESPKVEDEGLKLSTSSNLVESVEEAEGEETRYR